MPEQQEQEVFPVERASSERLLDEVISAFLPVWDNLGGIGKKRFETGFQQRLSELEPGLIANPELIDSLHGHALFAIKLIGAWRELGATLRSGEFQNTQEYLRREEKWLQSIRAEQRRRYIKGKVPGHIASWMSSQIENMQVRLKSAVKYMGQLGEIGALGRTDVASHVLLIVDDLLRSELKKPYAGKRQVIRAAFAGALGLVTPRNIENSDLLSAVNMRLSRCKQLGRTLEGRRRRAAILSMNLMIRSAGSSEL
ncbi:MAG: hypothetical protein WBX19_10905 [Terracidiphilus sp.]